ncbi:MAG TPA: type II toxin-antitoxin system VapC family toxin [Actinomycetales bacterium]|nr:type II toxin-antitoxin system VapC family toxin [Actinomycetales bacterium]
MSRLLLDTHILLWAISEPERLNAAARDALEEPSNELLVSAASVWEISTKGRNGKLPGAESLLASLESHMDRLLAQPLAISLPHARLAGSLMWEHRDPFDRMLAAQAILEGLTLVTGDRAFTGLPGLTLLR